MAKCGGDAKQTDDVLFTNFEKAAEHLGTIVGSVEPQRLLYLYARFKQAKEGPCNTPKPGFFNFQAKQKWEAWKNLGDMPSDQAMKEYVEEITNLDPEWKHKIVSEYGKKAAGLGLSVSTMRCDEQGDISDDQKTIFDWVKEGNLEQVTKLTTSDHITQLDDEGMSLLHWACDRGHPDIVKHLLKSGACISQQDSEGQTPLHFASSCGHLAVVKVLLENGADVGLTDKEGMKAIDVALDADTAALISR